MVLIGVKLSNNCDPTSSSKSNRGSVWIKIVTFISDSEHKNKLGDTYPIIIGLKDSSRE